MVRENREMRGWILNIIDRAKPYGASFEVIEVTLTDLGFNVCETEVKAQLKYLSDKGYVKYEPIERSGIVRHLNHITPKGVDLLEGSIPADPGVMIIV